jgi:peptide/histidine transporter 3/4
MNINYEFPQLKKGEGDICLADSATTHTILRDQKYFSDLIPTRAKVTTISGSADIIEGSGRAHVWLPNGTQLFIQEALYSARSKRNLLSFKDIRLNGYHIETTNENNVEYLCITSNKHNQRRILERMVALSSGLYHTTIKSIEAYHVMN